MTSNKDKPFYGTAEDKLKFLRYLRDEQRFTMEDLATKSLHSVETVKAWFSTNQQRKRPVSDRAVSLVLNSLSLNEGQYWVVVKRQD